MAEIVLGAGTSHSPMLALTAEQWPRYAQGDLRHNELVFPPEGWAMPYDEGLARVPTAVKEKPLTDEVFSAQVDACQRGIAELARTFSEVKPDITVIISDDQDEWFFEDNMPAFSVFWGESVPIKPRSLAAGFRDLDIMQSIADGYGDVAMDVPVASGLGRHVIEHMIANDFDVSHFTYLHDTYGGQVARRYPKENGELDSVRTTEAREQGLPHGFAFVVKRLFDNEARTILPIFQNTCYPPNQPTPKRSFEFGRAVANAVRAWDSDAPRGDHRLRRAEPLRGRRVAGPDGAEGAGREGLRDADDDPAQPPVLGSVRDAELDSRGRRDGGHGPELRDDRVRAGLPHARRHRRRLGLRPLGVG